MQKSEFIKKNVKTKSSRDGILCLNEEDSTTSEVAKFYSVAPFPNYEEMQNKADLQSKLFSNAVISDLKNIIGYNKKIIEVGSGTSQLSLALASCSNNKIVAFDPTIQSLELGAQFARKNKINNVEFIKGDLFEDPIIPRSFDVVWCSGVLHHTKSTFDGLEIISRWLKPGGYIFIGLYNKYGRLRTNVRQFVFKALGSKAVARKYVMFSDPHLRKIKSEIKKEAWIRDQYMHPVERSHTIDEVLESFKKNGINFRGAVPSCNFGEEFTGFSSMNGDAVTASSRIAAQLDMNFNSMGDEGGLFIVCGKKKY
jgi:ubiquinone/menaquinone biosynthesis C-methylase UbiE